MEWTPETVVDVDLPAALCRTYWEHRDLRDVIGIATGGARLDTAVDLACGFGRNCLVLSEFAARTIGLEREPRLLASARALAPHVTFEAIDSLAALPLASGIASLTLIFTVLQHLTDEFLPKAIAEAQRITSARGHILIVEETDVRLEAGSAAAPEKGYTRGRSPARYAELFAPRPLLVTRPRRIESTYPRPDVGAYMLFGPLA